VCGGKLVATDQPGSLFSHAKYGDQNYENKEDCEWLISADDDRYNVRLRFQAFEIEEEIDCGLVRSHLTWNIFTEADE